MYNLPLVANDFDVPDLLETEPLRLRPLNIHDVVRDYDAVMTSEHRLHTVFEPGGDWPRDLTLEQNIIELDRHQTEFQLRTSFAYTVVSLDELEVMGCVYIYPTQKAEFDAEVTFMGAAIASRRGPRSAPLRHRGVVDCRRVAIQQSSLSGSAHFV